MQRTGVNKKTPRQLSKESAPGRMIVLCNGRRLPGKRSRSRYIGSERPAAWRMSAGISSMFRISMFR